MEIKDRIRELAKELTSTGEFAGYQSVSVGLAAVVLPDGRTAQAQLTIQLDKYEWIEEPEELGVIRLK